MIKSNTLKKTNIHKGFERLILMLLLFSVLIAVFMIKTKAESRQASNIVYKPYTVNVGDTLNEIVINECNISNKQDIRKIVYDIEQYNDCTALIKPNQVLYIPDYKN